MDIIKTQNIIKNYQNTNVLNGIDLTIQKGEFIGIMGKSGSGKTTLVKILGMIEPKTDGMLCYNNMDVENISEKEAARIRREELGFIFQEFFLVESLNILENVMLPLLISCQSIRRGLPMAVPGGKNVRIDGKEKARVLMKQFGIEVLENKMPYELSGGERQRTAICRALIHDPQIIFADEPTGNLDSKSGKIVIDALQTIHLKLGKTVIMVTHDPQMASYCDRIILLKDGMILGQLERRTDTNDFYKKIIERMIEL